MEPIEWIVGFVLFIGSYELWVKEEPQELVAVAPVAVETITEQSIVSVEPLFERDRYYRTEDGYFISNLTPTPKNVSGCDRSVLTADLTTVGRDEGQIQVTEVDIECEG